MSSETPILLAISRERISAELLKIFDSKPALGARLLEQTHILYTLFPEFRGAKTALHDQRGHHDLESVWDHTVAALERSRSASPEFNIAVLLHDIGKMVTRTEANGKVYFIGHENAGAEIASKRLKELRFPSTTCAFVSQLIRYHMAINNKIPPNWFKPESVSARLRNLFSNAWRYRVLSTLSLREYERRSLVRLWIELHEDLPFFNSLLDLCEADTGEDLSVFRTLFRSYSRVPRGITGSDVMKYPEKIRGALIKQMRYIQLSQHKGRRALLSIIDGEANNIALNLARKDRGGVEHEPSSAA